MKKNYLLLLILFVSFSVFSQSIDSNCHFDYKFNLTQCDVNLLNKDKFVTIDWDFSNLAESLVETRISIEIIPIYDCSKELNSIRLKEPIVFSNDDDNFKLKSSFKMFHSEVKAKCFKYRVKILSNCEEVSDWKFYSFIN